MFHCSGPQHPNISDIIDNIPKMTNWVLLDYSNITEFCGLHDFLNGSITYISLQSANIDLICDDTLNMVLSHVKSLNLRNNLLTRVSSKFMKLSSRTSPLTELWLGGNPIHCDCSMTWMIDFLANSSLPSGNDLVKDYMDVICADPVYNGTPVYQLKPVKMGCYPRNQPIWVVKPEVAGSIGGGVIFVVVLLLIIYHKWTLVRWMVYKHTGKLIGATEKAEDLDGIEYDAFLSYRYQ